jgi:hypothetical protein
MPNEEHVGHVELTQEQWIKEHRKDMAFFSRISDVLQEFADVHNITIGKYDHNGPRWIFLFRHPEGGLGQIGIDKSGDENVMVYSIWSVRDYEKRIKGIKTGDIKSFSLDHVELKEGLENIYKTILSWRFEDIKKTRRLFTLNRKRAQDKYEHGLNQIIEGAKYSTNYWDNWNPEKI